MICAARSRPAWLGFAWQKEIRDRVLNHVSTDVGSKHYNLHDYADEKRDALNRWAKLVNALVTGTGAACCGAV